MSSDFRENIDPVFAKMESKIFFENEQKFSRKSSFAIFVGNPTHKSQTYSDLPAATYQRPKNQRREGRDDVIWFGGCKIYFCV